MTQPFPTYRGASYRLSMRCSQRQMLLLPSDIVNQTVGYWLGVTSLRFGLLVHAVCVMSNHIHLDVTDPNGLLGEFPHDVKGILARAMNAHWVRWENFWAPNKRGAQRVVTRKDAVDGRAYTSANPVKALLVASPDK